MLTTDDIITRGAEAEQAREYIQRLIAQARETLLDRLINLAPDQTLLFTIYRSQIQCLDDIPAVVENDITAGRTAIAIVQGDAPQPGGIL